jgi:hypothetical protein
VGEVEFYLADYRFTDNTQDYIVEDWATLDVSSLRSATSLEFHLSSSDVGVFGMNTPAYFAVDNVVLARKRIPLDISVDSVSEGAGSAAATARVSRDGADWSSPLVVTLHSDDPSEAAVPATVTIPADQSWVEFNISAVDDDLVDGPQSVTFTATAVDWAAGTASIEVTDDDVLTLTLATDKSEISEAAGPWAAVGTVTRNATDLSSALTVTVTSDDVSEASTPIAVTIPQNQASIQFPIDAVDDAIVDGSHTVTFTASATDYVAGQTTLDVTDDDALQLSLVIAESSVSEADGLNAATGTVSRNDADLSSPLVVTLHSHDTSELNVPSSVTIPVNQRSATFSIDAVDDELVDGLRNVAIRAMANGYIFGRDTLNVTDNDVLTLTLTIADAEIAEHGGVSATTGTIQRNDAYLTQALDVTLHSDDASEAIVPTTVRIPANQSSVQFAIEAVDDTIVDQTQSVVVTASATGYLPGSDSLRVTDDDVLTLTVTVADRSISEAGGDDATSGTVTRNDGDLSEPLTVTLASDDTSAATVPATVTIPANESSAPFAIASVDDDVVDGPHTATITADAADYVSGSASLDVTDDDVLTLTVAVAESTIGEPAGVTTGTVHRNDADLSRSLTVTLRSDDSGEATVPASATIPANQAFVDFTITAVDDAIVDGSQSVTIIGEAAGYVAGSEIVAVMDDDQLTLTLSIADSQVFEDGGSRATTGTVSRNDGDLSRSLTVLLASSDTSAATVADSLTIPAGQSSATFPIAAVDDAIVDGPQLAGITATATDYVPASESLTVRDDDIPTVTVRVEPASLSEGAAPPTAHLEELGATLADGSFWNGADGSGGFQSGGVAFNNDYNADWGSWFGWAYSNTTDTTTAGYGNQYSAYPGGGGLGSATYAVAYAAQGGLVPTVELTASTSELAFRSVMVANATYTALSMLHGDAFSKQFGGDDGSDPDWLMLTIEGLDAGGNSVGTVDFYLADYRSPEHSQDYIVDTWTPVDVSELAGATKLAFSLSSSDMGAWGMNTPAYFAMDNVVLSGAAVATGTVHRNDADLSAPLTVALTADDATEVSVPSRVTIPAGQASAQFAIDAVDDAVVDGPQFVTVTGQANGYAAGSETLEVADDDVLTLTLSITDSVVAESDGAAASTGTVHRNAADLSSPLIVSLASNDRTAATVPASVTIPAGQASMQFAIDAVDDETVDGDRLATIAGAATGYVADDVSLTVTDEDVLTLTLSIADEIVSEGAGAAATSATVSRNDGDLSNPLVVSLTNDDRDAVGIPASVTIPADRASIDFPIDAVDDPLVDDSQVATITASASGYVDDRASLVVADDDVLTLTLTVAPGSISESDAPPTARLEDLGGALADQSFWNGSDGSGGFETDGVAFNNDYNAAWESWSGWAYSNATDTTTGGYGNQYSAYAGGGALDSATYAVAYAAQNGFVPTVELTAGTAGLAFQSVAVTNTTYTALSMLHGDGFSKQFGGADGSDPDWLLLTIEGLDTDGNSVGTVDFYLADYRSPERSEDYIIDTWSVVDVSDLVGATKLAFSLSSSDMGAWGMNTPAYFALDNVVLSGPPAATGTVHRNDGDLSAPLAVVLATDDTTEAAVPTSVTIPAGQSTAQFAINAVNDAVVDGSRDVTLTAEATGYGAGSRSLTVEDDDVRELTLSVTASTVSESAGAAAAVGTVHRNDADLSSPLTVTLFSSDWGAAAVRATVKIPAGQSTTQFAITAVDDEIVDGPQAVEISSLATGYAADNVWLTVTDDDVLTLTLSLAEDSVSEDAGAAATTGTIHRNDGDLSSPLTVTLASDNPGAATVPSSVTIPSGQSSIDFDIAAVANAVVDGTQFATISAVAAGYVAGSAPLEVFDDDVLTLTLTVAADSISEADAPPAARLEDLGGTLADQSYWNGADGSGGFETDGVAFNNDYHAAWGSWSGWAYSNTTDTATAGYENQYSAYPGGGALGSATYAVAYAAEGGLVPTVELTARTSDLAFQSIAVTNTTYAALSMLHGDGFSKQFGGADGSDPDWFMLTIDGLDADGNSVGTVDFYLADYRSPERSGDYIVDTWSVVDLSDLVGATKLAFSLSSSDMGAWGMNTPAYFAVDNVVLSGGTAATGTVHRNDADLSKPVTVTLTVDDVTEATVPESVTIPAGQASVQFPVVAVNDAVADGTRAVTVTGEAVGYAAGSDMLEVSDDDLPAVTLWLDAASFSESAGSAAALGTVRRNDGDVSGSLVVELASDDPSEAAVPASVTIPAGRASATFPVDAVDDSLVDGPREVSLTASVAGYANGTAELTVLDREDLVLEVAVDEISEKKGVTTATVTRTDASGDLIVGLATSDDMEVAVVTSIVIPDGQLKSAEFDVAALDDGVLDGDQTALIIASAAGYNDGVQAVKVIEYTSWQSYTHPCDVNVDGFIVPLDILLVVDDLNRNQARLLPSIYANGEAPPPYVDVTGDGKATPEDVLLIVDYINQHGAGSVPTNPSASPSAAGEGEFTATGLPALPAANSAASQYPVVSHPERDRHRRERPVADAALFDQPKPRREVTGLEFFAPRSDAALEAVLDVIAGDVEHGWRDALRDVHASRVS